MPAARKPVSPARAKRTAPARKRADPKPLVAAKVVEAKAGASAPADKPRKIKVLRDTFRIPANEYETLAALKERAAKAGHPARKSEVLRAGVKALAAMGELAFLAALGAVPPIKPARAAKS
jgi:hypothetical protein